MKCASCGKTNRPNARFCGGCGQPLAPRCARCGRENAADAKFCDACGTPLPSEPWTGEVSERKFVTLVLADLIGSVGLRERLDAENARRFTARYHDAISAAVRAHGGTVVQRVGDGVVAAFGVPSVSQDDALRGVRAAVAMQAAFGELLRQQAAAVGAVGLRIAVNTGSEGSDDQTGVIGDPTHVAARLQEEARAGDVLIDEATQRLVSGQVTLASLGSFVIPGRVERVAAYRVVSLEPPARVQGTPFVSREEIPPNAAVRAGDLGRELVAACDWAGLEALCAAGLVFDDRRPLSRLVTDRAGYLASVRAVANEAPQRHTVLATSGDRLALYRDRFSGHAGQPGEIETLTVVEVDADGRIAALVLFAPADRRAAGRELLERSRAVHSLLPQVRLDFALALNDHDLARVRAALSDDFVLDDHRRTGMGRIEGADAYVKALAALIQLSGGASVEPLYELAVDPRADIAVTRTFGKLASGGEFESLYVRILSYAEGRIAGIELFELDDLERARERFEQLRGPAGGG